MVIGTGLLASNLSKYQNNSEILVFASGVSNSKETKLEEFKREQDLLATFFGDKRLFIYFSTLSIFDVSRAESGYVQHKFRMEQIIKENFDNYLIIRLPIVVSRSSNPNTLFNYLRNSILNGDVIQLHLNAYRYLIDVDDIGKAIDYLVENKVSNKTINVSPSKAISVKELVTLLEKILKKHALVKEVVDGCYYQFEYGSEAFYSSEVINFINEDAYYNSILNKYCNA